MYMVKVSLIKVVQIRTESDGASGKTYGWNKKFQKPGVAADHWAHSKFLEWEQKNNFPLKNHPDFYQIRLDRLDKLRRRSLPVFKRMLAP
jgi:hypothetical protein